MAPVLPSRRERSAALKPNLLNVENLKITNDTPFSILHEVTAKCYISNGQNDGQLLHAAVLYIFVLNL